MPRRSLLVGTVMRRRDRMDEFIQALKQVRLRPYDYVVVAVAVLVIGAFSYFALEQGGPAQSVEIRSDQGEFVYPLDQDRELRVAGPLGDSVIVIEDGSVRFTESPCRDKICIAAGHLTHSGDWTACLPNRVFVSVSGAADADSPVDATAF